MCLINVSFSIAGHRGVGGCLMFVFQGFRWDFIVVSSCSYCSVFFLGKLCVKMIDCTVSKQSINKTNKQANKATQKHLWKETPTRKETCSNRRSQQVV